MDRKKIDDDLAIIFEGITDPSKIEALGRVKGNLDAAEKRETELAEEAHNNAEKWKEAVLHGGYVDPNKDNSAPTQEPAKPKTFLEFLKAQKEQ